MKSRLLQPSRLRHPTLFIELSAMHQYHAAFTLSVDDCENQPAILCRKRNLCRRNPGQGNDSDQTAKHRHTGSVIPVVA